MIRSSVSPVLPSAVWKVMELFLSRTPLRPYIFNNVYGQKPVEPGTQQVTRRCSRATCDCVYSAVPVTRWRTAVPLETKSGESPWTQPARMRDASICGVTIVRRPGWHMIWNYVLSPQVADPRRWSAAASGCHDRDKHCRDDQHSAERSQ